MAILIAGCGNQDVDVPVECREGPSTVRAALVHAPRDVRLEGRVRISDCFQHAAVPADVQEVGATMLSTETQLADRVRRKPHSAEAVQLGYLVGAVRRGADAETGVHYETRRRLEQELVGVPTATPEYRRGLDAGRREG